MINPSKPSPHFSYCKRQKLGVEAWEQSYVGTTMWAHGKAGNGNGTRSKMKTEMEN